MPIHRDEPPEHPEPPECCGDFMDVEEDGSCWCSTCGKRIEPPKDIEPVEASNETGCLIGRLVWAGDLTVNGESISGVTVEISRETLAAQPIPMYQRMAVVPAELLDGWTVKYEEWQRLADAAAWLARACKDRLPCGHFAKLDQEYTAVREILSSQTKKSTP